MERRHVVSGCGCRRVSGGGSTFGASDSMNLVEQITSFLNGIGIVTMPGVVPSDSFLPGIRVTNGTLVYDPASLTWPGDLLHEAAHIAIAPAALRGSLSDGVELPSSVPHASEAEATAWAFAAVRHLQLETSVLFHEGGYRGASPSLIRTFELGVYPGAFGLAQAGLTHVGPEARRQGLPVYPAMARWLRP